jgi:branched-subunit amino acid ABC-type transport system permease component
MIFLYFMIIYFFILLILGWTLNIATYRLLKKNKFIIKKTNYGIGYSIKELSQLYEQTNSFEISRQITTIVKLTRWSKRLWWIYASIFIVILILTLFLKT